jgi:hypothetical protein
MHTKRCVHSHCDTVLLVDVKPDAGSLRMILCKREIEKLPPLWQPGSEYNWQINEIVSKGG